MYRLNWYPYGIHSLFPPYTEVPMKKIYKVTLTADERLELTQLVSNGTCSAKKIKHANILLAVDETENGRVSDQDVAKQFHCHANTVATISRLWMAKRFSSGSVIWNTKYPPAFSKMFRRESWKA